jgi:transposase
MSSITEKRLEKVNFLENIFKKFEKSKLPPTVFCKLKGIHTSKFYYWWNRYKKMGTKGLVDRREGVAYKVTEEIKEYIRDAKKKDRLKSGADISKMIKNRFGKTVSIFHIQRIMKELGLNDPVGRKLGKPIKKTIN